MRRIGENVRFYRNLRGLTQTSLARRVEVAPAYISQIEANQRVPSLKVTRKIAEILEIDLSVLLREADPRFAEGRLSDSEKLDLLRTLMISIEGNRRSEEKALREVRLDSFDLTELASEPSFCIILRTFHAPTRFAAEDEEARFEVHVVLQGAVQADGDGPIRVWKTGECVPGGGNTWHERTRLVAQSETRVVSVYAPRVDLSKFSEVGASDFAPYDEKMP